MESRNYSAIKSPLLHHYLKKTISELSSTSTSSIRCIKLSAKHLNSRRELTNTIVEFIKHRPLGREALPLEFQVDLTEIETEIGKQVVRQVTSVEDFDRCMLLNRLRPQHQDFVVTQVQGDCLVSDHTIKKFCETFSYFEKLDLLKSVDISACTLPIQVSILRTLLSVLDMKRSHVKFNCKFFEDFSISKEKVFMLILNHTSPLVAKGQISKEEFQELITYSYMSLPRHNEKVTQALIAASVNINITKDSKTALFYAVDRRNTDDKVIHALIEAGADVNKTDKDGKTALFYSVRNKKVTNALIEAGVDINKTDEDGKTALFYAVYHNMVTAHALIEAGADVNKTDKHGKTALFYAVYNKKVTQALIEAGVDVNIADKHGKTALFYAIDKKKVTHALIKAGVDVKIADKEGKTALFYAIQRSNVAVTHALIGAKADVNKTDKVGKTALFYTIDRANADDKVAHALIAAGADVNITDKHGKTALFYSVYNEKIANALIAAGADVNIDDKDGKTALFYAVGVRNDDNKVTHALIAAGADVNIADRDGRTVLLHILADGKFLQFSSKGYLKRKIEFLLANGARICETTETENSVFHSILKIYEQTILSTANEERRRYIFLELMDILKLFSQSKERKVAVNKRDTNLNSPLHLWASLPLAVSNNYHAGKVCDGYSFENLLKEILDLLLECGVQVDDRNENRQTPLHMCRTWTAVKLLLKAGAEPDVTDSSGNTPLLTAAKENVYITKDSKRFYPDVTEAPIKFWKEVLDKKLDPWSADKDRNSVLSVLIKEGANCLAQALIEIACQLRHLQSDAILVPLLITVCRDNSMDKVWKVDLVKTLLKHRNSLALERLSDKDTALHFSFRIMSELPEESVKTSVHWKIAQHLILCGADVEATSKEGKSCSDMAENCPVLKELLSMPVNIEEVPPLIDSWKPVSAKHQDLLTNVSRGFNCQQIETVSYFKKALDHGTFGLMFVGISIEDGKEVAVKRVESMRVEKQSTKKETEELRLVMSCDKIIQCLLSIDDKDFLYVILELMEGNLDDLLSGEYHFNINEETKLCKDICTGLNYLHNHDRNIIHRAVKPRNILYQVLPSGINLKLAFFGLKNQMCKEQCPSDFTGTYECLTMDRCWMAPEVLQSQSQHSKSSDVFSCGLVMHYLLTNKKHPFAPGVSSKETSPLAVSIEIVENIAQNKIELDGTLSSDANELLKGLLDHDAPRRISMSIALEHGFLQSKPKNIND